MLSQKLLYQDSAIKCKFKECQMGGQQKKGSKGEEGKGAY
jgi:hypothetical protein